MKKVLCVLLAILILTAMITACSDSEEKDILETITFEKIAQVNSLTNLLKNYDSITERTVNKSLENNEEFYWDLSYEKKGDTMNAIVDTGDQYKCFYYNGKIFASYDGEYLPVIYFRETYSDVVTQTIKRDNLLNTVYHTVAERSVLDDGRYVITFEFKATPEMIDDFETWKVKKGQKMQITYFLKDNLEIDHYDYYIFDANDKKKNIANVYVSYNSDLEFPKEVVDLVNSKDTYSVTLYENYGLGSQYSESYDVPKGSLLEINSYLYSYNVYQDPEKEKLWDFENNVINKDTNLYLYENIYYEVEEETGDTIITREETENE